MSTKSSQSQKAVLVILDGFGIAPDQEGNAISKAHMPVWQTLISSYPVMTLRASGEDVGLRWGEMGNSEVGHLTIGAGRILHQTIPQIDRLMDDGSFFDLPVLCDLRDHLKKTKGALHLVGLLSDGDIHACKAHIYHLLEWAETEGLPVVVHAILDGRDAIDNSGLDYMRELQTFLQENKGGKIGSVSGRYFAMDRDNRWDRTHKAFDTMVKGKGRTARDPLEAIKESYAKGIFDERFVPTAIVGEDGKSVGSLHEGDAVLFFNIRADRMRQLAAAYMASNFQKFSRGALPSFLSVSMITYDASLPISTALPQEEVTYSLAEVLSQHKVTQLHIAETEKYAHITYFLNGKREKPFEGETRKLIPSPLVSHYDETPGMSAEKITDAAIKAIYATTSHVVIINFANPDMVGHTGNKEATLQALKVTDVCLGRLAQAVEAVGGWMLITGDHGNAEELTKMRTGEADKEHSTNPVPLVFVGSRFKGKTSRAGVAPEGDLSLLAPSGGLCDIAPTFLNLLGIDPPLEMTGHSLWP
ncbi:TPA: 2,3-bisphosphoglycerate-independent phosphoglycerate mutase [Candidatus Uhrbacteria bacterium]|uniref:2,3-bisphosphoglycerate-independent phosphoglycerate mutase n=2 Tax=Candidatus Uhriibacteriota TaxID=1752732 RepID=A0A0G1SDW8_9BACT|nr:MAG: 2,3-bisphosphoglycerate-independent phosphoglycerate mutase [Candidatus Uhrbacteria bacterium GW2011_GWF2_46_218]KKU40308.1 MAG: 2,3-bisphosphoglycerate-independent phosphoglycerate mutase [Candidatus Uhrbacteria bacterium GW2011_GWE2_46_68]HBK33690.1 2,3-bisphosphoglycerate-independent phosphoglycerate mutase [Candidatus Uhrbacteria bacterium]HCB19718.1 2,3-bisphosphoglycerate-independent phosphoglycerate mutase [Candidatus Uhrbacteria bacterium]